MKVTKVVTKLEAQQRQANAEWEGKEQKVLQKLKRLDTYQVRFFTQCTCNLHHLISIIATSGNRSVGRVKDTAVHPQNDQQ